MPLVTKLKKRKEKTEFMEKFSELYQNLFQLLTVQKWILAKQLGDHLQVYSIHLFYFSMFYLNALAICGARL